MTPVWLLDVDGVLNARKPGWGAKPQWGYAVAKGEEWKITFAPALIRRIRALNATGLVEIRWCTTWCLAIGEIQRIMSLPPFRRVAFTETPGLQEAHEEKADAALRVLEEGRRLIWTDDEAIPATGAVREELDAAGSLLIVPSPGRGLQPEHLDAITAFIGQGDA